jgi:hypothetical protein
MKSRGCDCHQIEGIADTAAHYRQSRSRRRVPSLLQSRVDRREATGDDTLLDLIGEGREKGEQGSAHRVGDDGK